MEDLLLTVHLCTKQELDQEAGQHNVDPWYGLKHLRGFMQGMEIWVVKDCVGELALLAHEYGHVRGKKHTWFPSIMNFSGLFRWFCYHPFELVTGSLKRAEQG